jgi:hypothetical protein
MFLRVFWVCLVSTYQAALGPDSDSRHPISVVSVELDRFARLGCQPNTPFIDHFVFLLFLRSRNMNFVHFDAQELGAEPGG